MCYLLCISIPLKSILGLKSKQLLLFIISVIMSKWDSSCQNAAASTMRLRSRFYADSPSAAVWNCWFEQNSISIIQHSLLIGDYKEPFEQCGFFSSDTRRGKKMEPHQSLYLIKGSLSAGSITTSPRIDLTALSLPLFVARTSHLFVTS